MQTIAPIAVAAPSITGGAAPQTGQLLSTTNGTWSGATGVFTYVWQRCDASGNSCSAIGGATASTYAVVSADVGNTLRSVVTASNVAGSTPSSASAATGVVSLAGSVNPPLNTVAPVISLPSGETAPQLGDILFASAGTWTGSFPMTFTYSWTKCEPADPLDGPCVSIPGATLSFFTVPPALYGMRIRVRVTATNSAATVAQSSAATEIVGATAPSLSVTPPILGQNVVGQTLSVGTGTWLGSTPLTYTYQWRRCNPVGDLASCTPISLATKNTYIPTTADIGFSLRVYITATNAAGFSTGFTNHTLPVIDKQHFKPLPVNQPAIAGTLQIGRQLTGDAGSFDGDIPITTKLQWQRCDATGAACRAIRGATKVVYFPTVNDLGSTLRFVVTAKNAYGTTVADSDQTDPVLGVPPHRRGRRIVGTNRGDYLAGGGYDDVIIGGPGNDTIFGGAGDDQLYGGPGNDVITGGAGADKIYGGPGSDTIYADDGERDVIDCGPGRDRAVVDAVDVVKHCEVTTVAGSSSGGSSPTALALARRVQQRECVAELRPLGVELGEGEHQPALALGRQTQVSNTGVGLRLLALDEPGFLGAAHELGDGALRELQAIGELGHGRLLAAAGGALDHQQQQITLRGQAGLPRDAFAAAQELAQGCAKLCDRHHVADPEARHGHRPPILLGRRRVAKTRAKRFGSNAWSGAAGA